MNQEVIKGIIRHALGIAGGWLLAKGIELSPASIEAVSGGLAAVFAIAWSAKSKKPVEPKPLDK